MKIVTAAEMGEIDRLTTERYGIASLTLMENAGAAVAEFILEQYPAAQRIGIICGKGNNGGDGFVAARKLHEAGKKVSVLLLADASDVKGDAAEMLKQLPVKPFTARSEEELKSDTAQKIFEADVLVDALLGTGFKPPLQPLYRAGISSICNALKPVVSVDLPSGIEADSVDSKHAPAAGESAISSGIVTFTAPKLAHVFQDLTYGPIVVAAIGTPYESIQSKLGLEVITRGETAFVRNWREADSNKGNFGHVLVIGGSRGKAGAPAMSAMAALRSGAGLATVATAAGVQNLVSGFAAELMTEGLAETESGSISLRALEYGRMDAILKGKTVLAIGPGISRHPESAEFIRTLVHRRQLPVVLDADGLNAFEGHDERLDGTAVPLILTPHPGEMARLTGLSTKEVQADRVGVARKFAHDHDCIVVLKGWRTLVAQPDGKVWVNMTGNPGMATGGTGDILTGMIAAFLAQFKYLEPARAVIAAVRLHGAAGDIAAKDYPGMYSLIATDLLRSLPAAFRSTRWKPSRSPIKEGFDLHSVKEGS